MMGDYQVRLSSLNSTGQTDFKRLFHILKKSFKSKPFLNYRLDPYNKPLSSNLVPEGRLP